MELIRDSFIDGDIASVVEDESSIKLVDAVEFGYVDPVDGSAVASQDKVSDVEDLFRRGDLVDVIGTIDAEQSPIGHRGDGVEGLGILRVGVGNARGEDFAVEGM